MPRALVSVLWPSVFYKHQSNHCCGWLCGAGMCYRMQKKGTRCSLFRDGADMDQSWSFPGKLEDVSKDGILAARLSFRRPPRASESIGSWYIAIRKSMYGVLVRITRRKPFNYGRLTGVDKQRRTNGIDRRCSPPIPTVRSLDLEQDGWLMLSWDQCPGHLASCRGWGSTSCLITAHRAGEPFMAGKANHGERL
jgi:hypothetical protein